MRTTAALLARQIASGPKSQNFDAHPGLIAVAIMPAMDPGPRLTAEPIAEATARAARVACPPGDKRGFALPDRVENARELHRA